MSGLFFALAVLLSFAVSAAPLDLKTPEGQIAALRRIQCSEVDGKPVTFYWKGVAYSRVPGEPDRLLFRVEGMNTRHCGPLANAKSKVDFRLVTREILLYEDPASGEVLKTWSNPWTGKTVEVVQVANDPVNGNYSVVGRDGKPVNLPFEVLGKQWWLSTPVPLFYPNPLAGDYQQYIGGTYHATELFNFFGDIDDLNDRKRDTARTAVSWQRLSSWLPWMEMGDRAGMLYFHTAGRKLDKLDDLSATMKAEINSNYAEYRNPPPLDDQRPNETSWTYFKKQIDARKP
ncbi:MAG: DUF1838 domain-containing protein [Gammaproteobacteria bacterium]|nr:DUF1838 domain-containing protein [Gammaproteobacteria bacterium]MCP5140225.1 DUF1838 domain-containing protein [Chromatiales bacterium]